ncbi:hypothetical protein MSAN_00264800 [Mycena sanguinolenta]|uniref:Uncharacterized protein n=1 Tax=Mycena sanguinolenta TaxID=230812 RepID=A0A8H7DK68_9AGAR|nr:hypothetical protein MSAN_00264800 [Mycena sanguinolenta]
MNRLFKKIKSFRLGYTDEHPYPWRWTTPIVLCAFLFITPFLAVVNVPLSAYNIVQETVSSFPYYNNPLSDGCDSANITVGLSLTELPEPGWALDLQVSGTVMTWMAFSWTGVD